MKNKTWMWEEIYKVKKIQKESLVKFHVSYTLTSPYWDEPDSDIRTDTVELKPGSGEVGEEVIREELRKILGLQDTTSVSKIIAFSRIYEI